MLSLKNVHKTFASKKIIDNFSVSFCKGNTYSIIGPNGAGKTTLIILFLELPLAIVGKYS